MWPIILLITSFVICAICILSAGNMYVEVINKSARTNPPTIRIDTHPLYAYENMVHLLHKITFRSISIGDCNALIYNLIIVPSYVIYVICKDSLIVYGLYLTASCLTTGDIYAMRDMDIFQSATVCIIMASMFAIMTIRDTSSGCLVQRMDVTFINTDFPTTISFYGMSYPHLFGTQFSHTFTRK